MTDNLDRVWVREAAEFAACYELQQALKQANALKLECRRNAELARVAELKAALVAGHCQDTQTIFVDRRITPGNPLYDYVAALPPGKTAAAKYTAAGVLTAPVTTVAPGAPDITIGDVHYSPLRPVCQVSASPAMQAQQKSGQYPTVEDHMQRLSPLWFVTAKPERTYTQINVSDTKEVTDVEQT
jgi:hypothetical protein